MHIRCPHCHNPVELVDEVELSDVDCPTCGSRFGIVTDDADETISLGKREPGSIGHFELLEKIGYGAFGSVWKARDKELDRVVAMKIPRQGQIDAEETEKFLREARAAAQLKHPNIVSVYEVGRDGDTVFIVSELVDGITLSDWLTGRQPTAREAATLCGKTATALQHAHEKGVIHRDLKPSNVMIDHQGEPHLMDFGLAKREVGEITMTVDGQVLGTPAYMSPEQARGDAHAADRRSDVYALGVMLFEMLTGEKPFRGNTRMLLYQVLTEEPPSLRKLNANVPRDMETIALKCLEKSPGKRYQTASELSEELQRFLGHEPILTRPASKFEHLWRWCKRNPTVAALATSLASLLLGIGICGPIVALHQAALKTEQSKLREQAEEARETERTLRQSAESSHRRAVQQLLRSNAMRLAAQSQLARVESKELGLLLAIEAVEVTARQNLPAFPVAEQALRDAFPTVGGRLLLHNPQGISPAAMSFDGRLLAIGSADTTIRVWDLTEVEPTETYRQLAGHDGPIERLAFGSDSRYLVSGGEDGKLLLWDLANQGSLKPSKLLSKHPAPISSLAASPQSNLLVSCRISGDVEIWDLTRTDDPLAIVQDANYRQVDVNAEGSWLLTQGPLKSEVWKLSGVDSGPERVLTFRSSLSILNTAKLSPDGRWFAAAGNSKLAQVWDLSSPDPNGSAQELVGHPSTVTAIAFTTDGCLVTGYQDGTVSRWQLDVEGRYQIDTQWRAHDDEVKTVCFDAAGRTLITGSKDKTACIWSWTGDNPAGNPRVLSGHESVVSSLEIDKSGRWLVTDSLHSARLWDLASESAACHTQPLQVDEPVGQVAVSPDNRWLVTAAKKEMLELRTFRSSESLGPPLRLIGHDRNVEVLTISPDSRWLFTSTGLQSNFLWDLKSTDPATSAREVSHQKLLHAAFLPDSQMLVTSGQDGQARLWSVKALVDGPDAAEPVHVFAHGEAGFCYVAVDPKGNWLATNIDPGGLLLWSLSKPYSPEPLKLAATDTAVNRATFSALTPATFSPDGRWLIAGCAGGTVKLWDLAASAQPQPAPDLKGLPGFIWHMGVSPNGRWLVAASFDKSVCLWDLAAEEPTSALVRLEGHEMPIRSFAFSSDSRFLVTASIDTTLRVWRLDGDSPARDSIVLRGHQQDVFSVDVTPDGKWIISGSADSTVRFWDVTCESLLKRARTAAGRTLTAKERQRFGIAE